MAHGILNFSKSNPCPICGKPDWCGIMPLKDGTGKMILCMREKSFQSVIGIDGHKYVFQWRTGGNNAVYEELEQYNRRKACRQPKMEFRAGSSFQRPLLPIGIIDPKPAAELDQIYRFMQDSLVLEDFHRDYLHHQGWTDAMIAHYGVKSFPEKDHDRFKYRKDSSRNPYRCKLASAIRREFGEEALLGVPGAYVDDKIWTFNAPSGLIYPMYDMDGNMYRMRIRKDFRDVDKRIFNGNGRSDDYYLEGNTRHYICMKGVYTMLADGQRAFLDSHGKYRTLSSFYQNQNAANDGFYANIYDRGCGSSNEVSLYTTPEQPKSLWMITEGEPKGAYTSQKLELPVVTLPGVNSYRLIFKNGILGRMKEMGMEGVVVAFDADKSHNNAVLNMEQSLIKELKDNGVPTFSAEWDESIGKGIDDILAADGAVSYIVR